MKLNALLLLISATLLSVTACNASNADTDISTTNTTSISETSTKITETTTSALTTKATDTTDSTIPNVWSPVIGQRQQMKADGYLGAVAYIGYVDTEMTGAQCAEVFYDSRYSAEYPTITNIPEENCVDDCGGYELYLLIPADENATVSVNEWLLTEENNFMGESGTVYYRSETGSPLLIKCNVSDIMPNVTVNIVDSNGNSVDWRPSISLKDGSVSRYGVENKLCDITHYIYNETFECYLIEE